MGIRDSDMPVDISYFTFASSNPDAVMVDKYGVLTAVAPGQTEIAIQLGNTLYKIQVTVSKEQQEQSNMEQMCIRDSWCAVQSNQNGIRQRRYISDVV